MELMESEKMDSNDLLFNMGGRHLQRDDYQHNVLEWIKKNNITITEVNCDEFIFKKVLVGDNSDNIPAVVTWQKEMKNGSLRNYSLTDKMAEKIWEEYSKRFENFQIDYLFSDQQKTVLAEIIYRMVGKGSISLIKASLINNIALMVLHNKVIPQAIQNLSLIHI